jgi:pimeloyl-ACP methyl ester carboxylesterase
VPELKRPDGAVIYYEVIGEGEPVLCLGGWGTFCHGNTGGMPFGLTDRYQVVIMDYRGLAESTDNVASEATMGLYADDAIAVLDALGLTKVHLLGMVGIGACICQLIAIDRPDLARSLVNTGAWASCDPLLAEQLKLFVDIHREAGWATFQRFVCAYSFDPDFYNANAHRIVGPQGPWRELIDKIPTHERFIEASLTHDVIEQLASVQCPSFVLHAGQDTITGPRTTMPIANALPNCTSLTFEEAAHVLAGKELRQRFSTALFDFFDGVN